MAEGKRETSGPSLSLSLSLLSLSSPLILIPLGACKYTPEGGSAFPSTTQRQRERTHYLGVWQIGKRRAGWRLHFRCRRMSVSLSLSLSLSAVSLSVYLAPLYLSPSNMVLPSPLSSSCVVSLIAGPNPISLPVSLSCPEEGDALDVQPKINP